MLKASFVGEIAVVECQPGEKKLVKKFAQQLLQKHKNIRTVAVKQTITEGKYRVRKIKVIAGEKKTETLYRENGCSFKLDLNKAYFSPRLSFERQRVSELAAPGEKVLVLFAGVGPYAIVIARRILLMERMAEKRAKEKNEKKKTDTKFPKTEIVGVELNPAAVKYFRENARLNKVDGMVEIVKADAKKFLAEKQNFGKFDRITMPLPKTAGEFLEGAVKCCAKGGTIHFYSIESELAENIYAKAEEKISEACVKQKRKFRIVNERVALPYAPRVVQIVVDFKML